MYTYYLMITLFKNRDGNKIFSDNDNVVRNARFACSRNNREIRGVLFESHRAVVKLH